MRQIHDMARESYELFRTCALGKQKTVLMREFRRCYFTGVWRGIKIGSELPGLSDIPITDAAVDRSVREVEGK